MDGDPNFRLKAFAVIACVLGVFFVSFVAQRVWYWMKTRSRQDVDTSRIAPIIDFGLLGLGCVVIWMAVEALVLSVLTAPLNVQPRDSSKIAEIEIGKLDPETDQLNLLFYPVDLAGRRMPAQRRPVLTSGREFNLVVEVTEWRSAWRWLGEGGYYQFVSLGGALDGAQTARERTTLEPHSVPRTVGAWLFLRSPRQWDVRQRCNEGEVYDVWLNPGSGVLEIRPHSR